jgi:hypothetical protein
VNDVQLLPAWIAHVFDHPVADPSWYWSPEAPTWEGSPEQIATLVAETFERAGELLACFSDPQLDQGFWYLVNASCSNFMFALVSYAKRAKIGMVQ